MKFKLIILSRSETRARHSITRARLRVSPHHPFSSSHFDWYFESAPRKTSSSSKTHSLINLMHTNMHIHVHVITGRRRVPYRPLASQRPLRLHVRSPWLLRFEREFNSTLRPKLETQHQQKNHPSLTNYASWQHATFTEAPPRRDASAHHHAINSDAQMKSRRSFFQPYPKHELKPYFEFVP